MRKKLFLIFFVLAVAGYAQKKSIQLDLTYGISSPSSNFSDNTYAGDGNFIEFSPSYYFSKFGLGVSLGSFSNPTEGNLLDFANEASYSIDLNSEKWKTSYYGIGPSYSATIGSLEATFFGRAGLMSVKPISLGGNFISQNADAASPTTTIPVYTFSTTETSNIGFYNAGFRLGYKLNPNLGLIITANYLTAFSDVITAVDGRKQFIDINKDGVINEIDIIRQDGEQVEFQYTEKNIQPQVFNYGFGLRYSFGKRPTTSKEPPSRGHTNPYFVSNELEGEMVELKNSGTVVSNNASQKDKKQQQKIIGVLPKNNSVFKNADEIKNFTWQVIGAKIANPQFIIEVTKIGSNQQPQRTFIEKTTNISLGATRIFKENNLSDGQYRWKVTETTSGNSSTPMFFTFSNCEIDFSISDETIECLGYEGVNRKYKICFNSTYSSTSGDLTFANVGSGLTVFDQTYAPLTFTLVSPNPTLQTQIGATVSTVSYCFEVIVPASVTAIGFGLQGDDLDPSPVLCQPGVSLMVDELPDCICDDCDDKRVDFGDFNVKPQGNNGNIFDISGSFSANFPIYGVELQIQSLSYASQPTACSNGITSIEESGVFIMPSTSINNSSTTQLINETVSGSALTNNNVSKLAKYSSNTPLTGNIPYNLTLGVPGPISGLNADCCLMTYKVCIKVTVYYDREKCNSCTYTICFEFTNK